MSFHSSLYWHPHIDIKVAEPISQSTALSHVKTYLENTLRDAYLHPDCVITTQGPAHNANSAEGGLTLFHLRRFEAGLRGEFIRPLPDEQLGRGLTRQDNEQDEALAGKEEDQADAVEFVDEPLRRTRKETEEERAARLWEEWEELEVELREDQESDDDGLIEGDIGDRHNAVGNGKEAPKVRETQWLPRLSPDTAESGVETPTKHRRLGPAISIGQETPQKNREARKRDKKERRKSEKRERNEKRQARRDSSSDGTPTPNTPQVNGDPNHTSKGATVSLQSPHSIFSPQNKSSDSHIPPPSDATPQKSILKRRLDKDSKNSTQSSPLQNGTPAHRKRHRESLSPLPISSQTTVSQDQLTNGIATHSPLAKRVKHLKKSTSHKHEDAPESLREAEDGATQASAGSEILVPASGEVAKGLDAVERVQESPPQRRVNGDAG